MVYSFFNISWIRITIILNLLLLQSLIYAQNYTLTGTVSDEKTKELLAFVNLTYNNKQLGTTTDIDGRFKIVSNETIQSLSLSYVGYKNKTIKIPDGTLKINVQLEQSEFSLNEVVILPGENPAHRIIKKVQKNKELNSPQQLPFYTYTSYSKLIMTAHQDTSKNPDLNDTSFTKAKKFLDKQHLFLIEQVTEKKFKRPDKETETILAARVSGFQNPSFISLFTQLMTFGFYNEVISISDKDYINPIASGTFNKYSFLIEDTLYENKDSIYVISFKPKKGKNFDGLKGLLYISTNKYAICNVIAQPNEDQDGTTIKIQQKYEYIQNTQWFPTQLNSDIVFGNVKINNFTTVGIGRTYVKDINLNPDLKRKDFTETGIIQAEDAAKKSDEFWNKHRHDSLSAKELRTYQMIDSVGKKQKFDQKLKVAEILLSNKIRWKILDFDLDKFFSYNDFEGFRMGASLNTNTKFSRIFSLGAYGAFGTNDRALKYGANLTFHLIPSRYLFLRASFTQDLTETGGSSFYNTGRFNALSDDLRKILLERMDSLEKYEVSLHLKPFHYARINLFLNQQYRSYTRNYLFYTSNDYSAQLVKQNVITEAGAQLYYAYGEKQVKFGNFEITQPTNYPVFFVNFVKGFNQLFEGQLNYWRTDFKAEKSFKTKFIGRTNVQLLAGYINGLLPYSLLYNGQGSNKRTLSVSVNNSFETMRMNEFAANQFASVFILHDFGRLLYKSKRFEPRIAVRLNAGFGMLNNPDQHKNIALKDFRRGYYESGLLINSILKSSFSNLGVGAFYRFGPYNTGSFNYDLTIKLSLGFSF